MIGILERYDTTSAGYLLLTIDGQRYYSLAKLQNILPAGGVKSLPAPVEFEPTQKALDGYGSEPLPYATNVRRTPETEGL